MQIPKIGLDHQPVIKQLNKAKSGDVAWKEGRSWSLVYYAGDEHTEFLKRVYSLYFSENGAGPSMFPSLRRMEAEVVSMVAESPGWRFRFSWHYDLRWNRKYPAGYQGVP